LLDLGREADTFDAAWQSIATRLHSCESNRQTTGPECPGPFGARAAEPISARELALTS